MNETASHDPHFSSVREALDDLRAGKMIILVDDEDRENEGDLVIAAEHVTPEAINFMAKEGRGLICLSLTPERCDELELPLMSPTNTSSFGTGFTVSIEARQGVTTGISAADRAHTIKTAIDPEKGARDLARPGHIFPLRSREGGTLVRVGQTEGSVDLCADRRIKPCRGDLRDHERRRDHGPDAAACRIRREARPPHSDGQRAGGVSSPPRAVRPPGGRDDDSDPSRAVQHHRL